MEDKRMINIQRMRAGWFGNREQGFNIATIFNIENPRCTGGN